MGLPEASGRPPGPKTNQSKKPRNLKELTEQWKQRRGRSPIGAIPEGPGADRPGPGQAYHKLLGFGDIHGPKLMHWVSATVISYTPAQAYRMWNPVQLLYVTQYCFRVGNRPSGPDFGRAATRKTPKSALRPAEGPISVFSRWQSGQNPARKADFRPGSIIA